MLISTNTTMLSRHFGDKRALEILKEVGFDGYDYSMFDMVSEDNPLYGENYVEYAMQLRAFADEIGIKCNQSHAPFPTARPDQAEENAKRMQLCIKALHITSILGGEICIVHPCNDWSAEENAKNLYLHLLPYCKIYGVKIAVENMWNWDRDRAVACKAACSSYEDFNAHLALLDKEWFVACLDIGHAQMMGPEVSAEGMIHALGDRLKCLHVHDNDKVHDDHLLPFEGKSDWSAICKALREIKYDGWFTFEADTFIQKLPCELKAEGERYMLCVGKYLSSLIDEK